MATKQRGNQEGTFYQRKDGKWCGQVMINNKRYTVYGKGIQECRKKLREKIKEKQNENTCDEMFSDYAAKVINRQKETGEIRQRTAETKERFLKILLSLVGDYPLNQLDTEKLQSFVPIFHKKGLAFNTIKGLFSLITSTLSKAKKEKLITYVPSISDINLGAKNMVQKDLPPLELVKDAIDACHKKRTRIFLYTVLYTGLRGNEAISLKWSDIDFEKLQIIVNRGAYTTKGTVILAPPKSNRTGEYVQFSTQLKEILLDYKKESTGEYVFDLESHPYSLTIFRASFSLQLKKRGISGAGSIHLLRHLHASILLANKVDLKTIQSQLRHVSIQTTDRYLHSLEREVREDIKNLSF